jgi:hypothetical protein
MPMLKKALPCPVSTDTSFFARKLKGHQHRASVRIAVRRVQNNHTIKGNLVMKCDQELTTV